MNSDAKIKKSPKADLPKVHPWRLCPSGEHWVKTHSVHVPPSETYPEGHITTRHSHCAHNPSGKDQLYTDEIQEISTQKFSGIKEKPCSKDLIFGDIANKYDELIAGWSKYWNDIFEPAIPLSPNIVKALIATESSFEPDRLANKKNKNSARGLMQLTNATRKVLSDEKGELKDHFVTSTREELNDPSNNICAGIRWLFRKQEIASSIKKSNATWEETVAEFKGVRSANEKRALELMDRFYKKLEEYTKCGKP